MSALRNYQTRLDVHHARPGMVQNNTGGFVHQINDEDRLRRFLILGTDGGTYYVSETDLTNQNVDWLITFIKAAPNVVLNTVLDVSENGRAYKNSPAIFTMALMLNHAPEGMKAQISAAVPRVARTATMMYEFAQYIENLGGWGRAKRNAVANFFTSKTPDQLAYQAVKYRQRNGWTLRDLMRLSHPVGVDQSVGGFILSGNVQNPYIDILVGFDAMQKAGTVKAVIDILEDFPNLPWETIPTQFLKEPAVWKTLFYNNQLRGQAALRNVTRLQKIGAFDDRSFRNDFASLISDPEMMAKTRLHPIQYLNASVVYTQGSFDRSRDYGWGSVNRKKDWTADGVIRDALQDGFYTSFKNVEPSGKKFMIGIDVSYSMSASSAAGADLTAAQAAAFMGMMIAKVETDSEIRGFADRFVDLGITSTTSFDVACNNVQRRNFGATDMSLPIQYARQNRTGSEVFLVITDNEVNRGFQPDRELKNYRSVVPGAKMAVMAVTATPFTIADPNDPGMLDVVGFDSNAPKLISDFAKGF